ncbi:unnamed protein product, partial [Symbiodinium necroappetens]
GRYTNGATEWMVFLVLFAFGNYAALDYLVEQFAVRKHAALDCLMELLSLLFAGQTNQPELLPDMDPLDSPFELLVG